jgi:hypothetical protein
MLHTQMLIATVGCECGAAQLVVVRVASGQSLLSNCSVRAFRKYSKVASTVLRLFVRPALLSQSRSVSNLSLARTEPMNVDIKDGSHTRKSVQGRNRNSASPILHVVLAHA